MEGAMHNNKKLPENIERIIQEAKNALSAVLRGTFREMILFGSYARNDYADTSDIDLLLLLNTNKISAERIKFKGVIGELSLKYDKVISVVPFYYQDFAAKKDPSDIEYPKRGDTCMNDVEYDVNIKNT
jgi:predicted nucleotidyltransferase